MSEIRTNMLISGESSEYRSNMEISIVTLNSTLVDTHSSFRTNLDISTKLNDGSISSIKTNLELNNVSLRFNLVDMTKLNQSVLYFSKFFNMYFEPEVMWNLLAQGTNEQINISHLTDALSNYLTRDSVLGIEDYLDSIKETLTNHLKDDNRHFTTREKEFLLYLMENPTQGGGGESLFEKTIIGNNIPAVIPKKQEGKDAGIISNTFISCRGIDFTASGGGGGITRSNLFNILSGDPVSDSEFINNKFLKISPLIENWIKNNLADYETDPTVPIFVKNITEDQIKSWDDVASWFDVSDDDKYIYVTNTRGFVSNSFISCKGLDSSTAISSGLDRNMLFDILSGTPKDGEYINTAFLNLEPILENYALKSWVRDNFISEELDPTVPIWVKAITEEQIYIWDLITSLFRPSEDDTYVYTTNNRGFVSNSFISCRGIDSSSSSSGSLTRNDLFGILSEPPQEGEIINLNYLVGLRELVDTYGYLKSITKNQIISALGDTPLFKSDFKDFDAVSNILQQDINNWNFVYSLIDLSEDKTYIYPKENRGIVSKSFISCKGLDTTSSSNNSGGLTRDELFFILSSNPLEGEYINTAFIDLSSYLLESTYNSFVNNYNLTIQSITNQLSNKVDNTTSIIAGNGLNGGGNLENNVTIELGIPNTINSESKNIVTTTSHTHEIDKATTKILGIVQLYDALDSKSTTLALTANQGNLLNVRVVYLEDMWENKTTYLLAKKDRGVVSNSFISCKGLDVTSSSVGSLYLNDLLNVTINNPKNKEVLTYDDSLGEWVNSLIESGLNIEELEVYLIDKGYIKESTLFETVDNVKVIKKSFLPKIEIEVDKGLYIDKSNLKISLNIDEETFGYNNNDKLILKRVDGGYL